MQRVDRRAVNTNINWQYWPWQCRVQFLSRLCNWPVERFRMKLKNPKERKNPWKLDLELRDCRFHGLPTLDQKPPPLFVDGPTEGGKREKTLSAAFSTNGTMAAYAKQRVLVPWSGRKGLHYCWSCSIFVRSKVLESQIVESGSSLWPR